MSTRSMQQLDELVQDLKLDKANVRYLEWKSEVQKVATGKIQKNK